MLSRERETSCGGWSNIPEKFRRGTCWIFLDLFIYFVKRFVIHSYCLSTFTIIRFVSISAINFQNNIFASIPAILKVNTGVLLAVSLSKERLNLNTHPNFYF